jgi:hypothetical protein
MITGVPVIEQVLLADKNTENGTCRSRPPCDSVRAVHSYWPLYSLRPGVYTGWGETEND